jgi:hypothetical protein
MANFLVESNADNGEVVSTLNYLLSNLGNAPLGLTINRQTGQIINNGTNTLTGYLYKYINIAWAKNIQGLYFSSTAAGQAFYGISNSDSATYPTKNTSFEWQTISGTGTTIGSGTNLYYSINGGRQITFVFATSNPGAGYVLFVDGTAIDLDVITFVGNSSIIGNNVVIGNYATIGNYLTIGNYWTAGTNGNIGANLTITGLTTNSVLNASTVGTTQLVNLAVTNGKLAANAVTTDKVQDYTLLGTDLANATVGTQQITDSAITNAKLAANAVTTDKVLDYTLLGTDLANATVTSQQIANYTIVAQDIANATITTSQVASYTLLGTNLANATVTSQQIANLTIVGDDIANATITSNKLSISTLSAISSNVGTLTAGAINNSGGLTISGFSSGQTISLANVTLTGGNNANTSIATYTFPSTSEAIVTFTGTVNQYSTESNTWTANTSLPSNAIGGLQFYVVRNSTGVSISNPFNSSNGQIGVIRSNATTFLGRLYLPTSWVNDLVPTAETYTIYAQPQLTFYNPQGNVVTSTSEVYTIRGRITIFQPQV